MRIKTTYIVLIGLIGSASFVMAQNTVQKDDFELVTTQNQFEAGSSIVLNFIAVESATPYLYCSGSYGSTLLIPNRDKDTLHYKIPANISTKSGIVQWKLLHSKNALSGKFKIYPQKKVASIETYVGPPSIEAGGNDYTMHVVIPTDKFDNPVIDATNVSLKHQFQSSVITNQILTNNLIAYDNIYSKKETGRMLLSSECLDLNSKEYSVNVMAAIPTNFEILANRHHNYADGNQITTFYTSVLKDKQNNVVSDGTFVEFFITNKKGNILKTSGTTIEGVATSKMIHPDHEEQWQIKAYVNGMAESNTIQLNYKQVISDFEVSFSENNRIITVGPLQSFMKQMMPDGLLVKLSVYNKNTLLKSMVKTSEQGFVKFNLKLADFQNDAYDIKIITADIEKIFSPKTLW